MCLKIKSSIRVFYGFKRFLHCYIIKSLYLRTNYNMYIVILFTVCRTSQHLQNFVHLRVKLL